MAAVAAPTNPGALERDEWDSARLGSGTAPGRRGRPSVSTMASSGGKLAPSDAAETSAVRNAPATRRIPSMIALRNGDDKTRDLPQRQARTLPGVGRVSLYFGSRRGAP